MLLAEELVLLALDADGTMARGWSTQSGVAVGVTGALVTELAQQGHVDLAEDRLRLTGTRPTHPLLAQVVDSLAALDGKKLRRVVGSVKHAGWTEVVDGMIEAGMLGREKQQLHPTRHPVTDRAAHAALLAEVSAAAAGDQPLDPRLATLLALAGPCQLLEVVAPERADRAIAKRRIAQATEQVPVAAAVRDVIQSMQAAVVVG